MSGTHKESFQNFLLNAEMAVDPDLGKDFPDSLTGDQDFDRSLSLLCSPQASDDGFLSLQVLEFKTSLFEAVEELRIHRDAEMRFEEQINKIVMEKQELEWEKESLQHKIDKLERQHKESLASQKKQLQAKIAEIEGEKLPCNLQGRHQLSADLMDKEIVRLKEEVKQLQLFKYSLQKKLSELEQKLQLQAQAKDSHLSQLAEAERRFGALSRQCATIKQAHETLVQNVEEAVRLNKKLAIMNKQQEMTIDSLKQDVEKASIEVIKSKVSSACKSGEDASPGIVKEQQLQQLHHKLNMETEMNKRLMKENADVIAEKQEVMSSLWQTQQLLQAQTEALSRAEQELSTHREERQALNREHKLFQEKIQEKEGRIDSLIEDHNRTVAGWRNEGKVLQEKLNTDQAELKSVKEAFVLLQEKYKELSVTVELAQQDEGDSTPLEKEERDPGVSADMGRKTTDPSPPGHADPVQPRIGAEHGPHDCDGTGVDGQEPDESSCPGPGETEISEGAHEDQRQTTAVPLPHQSQTAAVPPPDQRHTAAVPPPDQRQTAAVPPPDQRQTAAVPPPDQRQTAAVLPPHQHQITTVPPPHQRQTAAVPLPDQHQITAVLPPHQHQITTVLPPDQHQIAAVPPPGHRQTAAVPPPDQRQITTVLPPPESPPGPQDRSPSHLQLNGGVRSLAHGEPSDGSHCSTDAGRDASFSSEPDSPERPSAHSTDCNPAGEGPDDRKQEETGCVPNMATQTTGKHGAGSQERAEAGRAVSAEAGDLNKGRLRLLENSHSSAPVRTGEHGDGTSRLTSEESEAESSVDPLSSEGSPLSPLSEDRVTAEAGEPRLTLPRSGREAAFSVASRPDGSAPVCVRSPGELLETEDSSGSERSETAVDAVCATASESVGHAGSPAVWRAREVDPNPELPDSDSDSAATRVSPPCRSDFTAKRICGPELKPARESAGADSAGERAEDRHAVEPCKENARPGVEASSVSHPGPADMPETLPVESAPPVNGVPRSSQRAEAEGDRPRGEPAVALGNKRFRSSLELELLMKAKRPLVSRDFLAFASLRKGDRTNRPMGTSPAPSLPSFLNTKAQPLPAFQGFLSPLTVSMPHRDRLACAGPPAVKRAPDSPSGPAVLPRPPGRDPREDWSAIAQAFRRTLSPGPDDAQAQRVHAPGRPSGADFPMISQMSAGIPSPRPSPLEDHHATDRAAPGPVAEGNMQSKTSTLSSETEGPKLSQKRKAEAEEHTMHTF